MLGNFLPLKTRCQSLSNIKWKNRRHLRSFHFHSVSLWRTQRVRFDCQTKLTRTSAWYVLNSKPRKNRCRFFCRFQFSAAWISIVTFKLTLMSVYRRFIYLSNAYTFVAGIGNHDPLANATKRHLSASWRQRYVGGYDLYQIYLYILSSNKTGISRTKPVEYESVLCTHLTFHFVPVKS